MQETLHSRAVMCVCVCIYVFRNVNRNFLLPPGNKWDLNSLSNFQVKLHQYQVAFYSGQERDRIIAKLISRSHVPCDGK